MTGSPPDLASLRIRRDDDPPPRRFTLAIAIWAALAIAALLVVATVLSRPAMKVEVGSAEAALQQSEAELAQAQRDLERARTLAEQQVLSTVELESTRTRLDVALARRNAAGAQLRQAQVNVENTRVRAPFDGTVLRK